MSDLIDRQSAINAVHECPAIHGSEGSWVNQQEVFDKIASLPTVQPEIVRCHKCIYWDQDTVRQNSNDAGWWNEAVCEKYSDEIWTAWKDEDWFCADAERRAE